jgi:hypothetical protein
MSRAPTWTLFGGMLREEWRLHTELFGGGRFGAFPLLVFGLASVGGWLLRLVDVPTVDMLAGLHVLVLLFGLHVGSIGLVGSDSLEQLLGDLTLLLSASRTLPISRRRLLGVFLLKDLVYYAGFFLLPVVAGLTLTGGVALAPVGGGPAVARAPQTFLALAGTLGLGFAAVFAGIALRTRGTVGTALLVVGLLALPAAWLAGVDALAWTPYALVAGGPGLGGARTATGVLAALAPTVVLAVGGLRLYDPTHRKPARTHEATFPAWRRRLRDPDGLLTKSLFDVARSGGGLAKVPFSAAIVLGVAVGTVELVGLLTGRPPAAGLTLGSLLGLTAFTTYNWLTQFDDPGSYLAHPLGVADVLRAKYRAFLALGPPVGLAFYLPSALAYGVPLPDLLAGAALALGVQGYLFGVTVFLAGLQPGEFLFDTVLFAAFTLAVAVVLVPLLVGALAFSPLSDPSLAAGVVAFSAALAGIGWLLARRALPRWTTRYRAGDR